MALQSASLPAGAGPRLPVFRSDSPPTQQRGEREGREKLFTILNHFGATLSLGRVKNSKLDVSGDRVRFFFTDCPATIILPVEIVERLGR